MEILFISMYSPPEKTGIGKYNGELVKYLSNNHYIYYLTTMPFYPEWKTSGKYKHKIVLKETSKGVNIRRLWTYTPKSVNSIKRILKEIQFFINNFITLFVKKIFGYKPDVLIYIAPPFFLPYLTWLLFPKSYHIYHVQDLEVDAAAELNLLPSYITKVLLEIELRILKKVDLVSTISTGMIKKLNNKGLLKEIYLLPNWVDDKTIYPMKTDWLHKYLNLDLRLRLVVYSGNIGKKQGFEILPDTISRICKKFKDVHFVILGEGVFKNELMSLLKDIDSTYYTISGLVEKENLNEMLNSSHIQLVIQKSEGSDSFMPSKLTNILAAGIPSVVTAKPNTGLFDLIYTNKCALLVEDSSEELALGIQKLINNSELREEIANNSIKYSQKNLRKDNILNSFNNLLIKLTNKV